MSGPTWAEVEALLPWQHREELVARLGELDDAGRKALVKPLREHARSGEWDMPPRESMTAMPVVGAAVLPDTRSTAAWLRRFAPSEVDGWHPESRQEGSAGVVLRVLVQRNASWLPQLVGALADRLRFETWEASDFDVVDQLRRAIGLEPPENPVYVAQWVYARWVMRANSPSDAAQKALRAEPAFTSLIPRAIEEDGLAHTLRETRVLSSVVTAGLVDRGMILDALLARLQSGGRPQATNDLVAVLEDLDPTDDELGARLPDYFALISPGTASRAAASAQAALLRAHASGTISGDDVLAASPILLSRNEKAVLRTQLGWLERYATENPDAVLRVASAAAVAFSSQAVDVQRRAVHLLASLAGHLDVDNSAEIGAAAELLPPDLMAELRAALVTPSGRADTVKAAPAADGFDTNARQPVTPALPQVVDPLPVVPLEDLDETIERLLVILRSTDPSSIGVDLERVVEALPRLAGTDGSNLRAVRHRFAENPTYQWAVHPREYAYDADVQGALSAVVATLAGDQWPERPPNRHDEAPERALVTRLFDLARALGIDRRVRVVSLPTDTTGALAPDVLALRLREAATAGWKPATLDLEQAHLRAGPHVHPAPVVTVTSTAHQADQDSDYPWEAKPAARPRTRVHLAPTAHDDTAPGTLWSMFVNLDGNAQQRGWSPHNMFQLWPTLLPHHPDVIAAHLVPALEQSGTAAGRGSTTALLQLAESPVPGGTAMHVALAHGLNSATAQDRAATVDSVLAVVARNGLDGAALGALLARMSLHREALPKRLANSLHELSAAGAPDAAWQVLYQLLTDVFTDLHAGNAAVNGLADVITTAAAVAALIANATPMPGLTELAARPGRSRQVVEAQRLVAILA